MKYIATSIFIVITFISCGQAVTKAPHYKLNLNKDLISHITHYNESLSTITIGAQVSTAAVMADSYLQESTSGTNKLDLIGKGLSQSDAIVVASTKGYWVLIPCYIFIVMT